MLDGSNKDKNGNEAAMGTSTEEFLRDNFGHIVFQTNPQTFQTPAQSPYSLGFTPSFDGNVSRSAAPTPRDNAAETPRENDAESQDFTSPTTEIKTINTKLK